MIVSARASPQESPTVPTDAKAALPWIGTPDASVHSRVLSRILSELGVVVADKVRVETTLSFVTRSARRNDPSLEAAFDVLDFVWT